MTHRDVDYSKLPARAKVRKALRDVIYWLGYTKYIYLSGQFKAGGVIPYERFANLVSIAGIQGYPVKVWYNRIYGLDQEG